MRRHVLWGTVATAVVMTVLGSSSAQAEGRGDIRITKGVTNNGKSVIVGISKTVIFPVKLTIKDNSGVKKLRHIDVSGTGSNASGPVDLIGTSCKKLSHTTSECTATMRFDPHAFPWYSDTNANLTAGEWAAWGNVQANDGDYWIFDRAAPFKFKRAATLTATAIRPNPFSDSRQVKVTGALARADWEALKYRGYGGQSLKLQFKKAGAASYTTVKTVRTNSAGKVGATVKASASGSWRWFYQGTANTMQVASPGAAMSLAKPTLHAARLP
ncbi:hypothetical protein AB0C40_15915 [Streptomyces brevispora]|uniref:hypothetical protein n=1 Tax=Streptomyces brevispora TaxID=887462 RepID=UPI0033E56C08